MKMQIPDEATYIIQTLESAGYEAYAVGGCVRDALIGREPEDWDITTSAKPEQVKALFRRTIDTGLEHGTVTIMIDTNGYEVTTYRVDGDYADHRHPKEVSFTSNLEEDLKRRDFTINAMAYSPDNGLVDIFQGREDLQQGIIRAVGNPEERFREDALRMLRAIRFSGQLGFEIETATREGIRSLAATISHVSAERIRVELEKLLISGQPQKLLVAAETGLTKVFLPEFDKMLDTKQENPHHYLDVGHHSMQTVIEAGRLCRKEKLDRKHTVAVTFAALLHDIAKPLCKTVDEEGLAHFHGHDKMGAELAAGIMHRLKFDNDTIFLVKKMVDAHDRRYEGGKRGMRRAMSHVGTEVMPYLFLLQEADLLSQSEYKQKEKLKCLYESKQVYEEILKAKEAVSVKELAIGGREVIALGVEKGPEIGRILNWLLSQVIENPRLNDKETLIQLVKQYRNVDKE